jgi:hypothetical protein
VKDILVSPSRLHRDINAPPSPHYHHGGLGKHWSSAPFSMPVLDDITKDLPPLTPSIVMRDKHEWEKTQEVESTPLARLLSQTLLRHPSLRNQFLLNPSVATHLTFLTRMACCAMALQHCFSRISVLSFLFY